MPEEPPAEGDHVKVSFKLPSGKRVMRRFLPSDSVDQILIVASALSEHPVSTIDVSTQFPKRSVHDVEGGLKASIKDAKLGGNLLLVETGKRRKVEK